MSNSRSVRQRCLRRIVPLLPLVAAGALVTAISPTLATPVIVLTVSPSAALTTENDSRVDEGASEAPTAAPSAAEPMTTTLQPSVAQPAAAVTPFDSAGPAAALAAARPAQPTAPPITSATQSTASTKSPADDTEDEADQHIASLGPAMRALHPLFMPVWPSSGEITTYFGEVGPYSPRGHAGLDIADDTGTPILAADEGEVLKAYWNADGYGGLVIIEHPAGYETWYGHLSRLGVEKGEHVTRGEQIGRMGSTGFSTGSHLHFEVRQDGELCDPLKYLSEAALVPHAN
jgi:murein DD-endopeptidase MepM/ murein hydrolase activator NlpD